MHTPLANRAALQRKRRRALGLFRVHQLLTDPCLANESNTVLTLLSSCCLGIKVSVEGPKVKNLSLNFEGLQSHRLLSLALSAISTMSHGDGSHPPPRSGWVLGTVPLARGTIICTPLVFSGKPCRTVPGTILHTIDSKSGAERETRLRERAKEKKEKTGVWSRSN